METEYPGNGIYYSTDMFMTILRVIVAFCLITHATYKVSEPSDLSVIIGIVEILLAIILVYFPIRKLIKNAK